MAAPKKGSRIITVDGVEYRWRVRRQPTKCQDDFGSWMSFSIELAQNPGSTLVVELSRPRPDSALNRYLVPVTPGEVANQIKAALESGWKPAEKGSPFLIKIDRTSYWELLKANRYLLGEEKE